MRDVPRDILECVEDAKSRLVDSKDEPDKVFCYAVREPDGQENFYQSVFYPGAEAAFREKGSFVKGPYRHDVVIQLIDRRNFNHEEFVTIFALEE